jgi:heme-degrading monooxygenase HmoA
MFRRIALTAAAAIFVAAAGRAADAGAGAALLVQKSASASPSPKPKPMIARIWHGRTLTAKADEYEKYLNASGVERILKTQGNHGVEVLRKSDGPRTDFIVISYWESIDAVKRFAGPNFERAVIMDRDKEFLIEVEPNVLHYEVVRTGGR